MRKLATITIMLVLFGGLAAANPSISVQLMETEPSPMEIGEYADVQFKVANSGDDAENISVELAESYPFSVDPDEKKSWKIRDFDSGDSYEFRVPVLVSPNAIQGSEKLEIMTGKDDSMRTHNLPVSIKADDDGLIVESVEFPERVGAGTSEEMKINLENTANAHFRNTEVSLGFSERLPMVASGTTRERIGSIAPGEQTTVSYTINIDESASNGVYSLPINLEYENEAGSELAKSQTAGIVIGGEPRVEAGINDAGDIQAGSSGSVTYRFVNRGEGTAKFVKVDFLEGENYSILSGESVYLGDMNPDDYQTAETEIHTEAGTDSITVPVQLTYRENGEEVTETQDVDVNVLTQDEAQLYGTGDSNNLLPIAVVLIVLVAGGVYYWRRKR